MAAYQRMVTQIQWNGNLLSHLKFNFKTSSRKSCPLLLERYGHVFAVTNHSWLRGGSEREREKVKNFKIIKNLIKLYNKYGHNTIIKLL